MASCTNRPNPTNSMDLNQNIPLSECMCPICMSILVEPVTLPCRHELCMPCFRLNIHETSMTCPMCRLRIATWSRQASRKNTLVNQKRWNQIRNLYPEHVNKRLAGMDEDDIIRGEVTTPTLSEPGEIRKEYEEEIKKIQEERDRNAEAEAAASEVLIRQLQDEENKLQASWKKRKMKQEVDDQVVAKELALLPNKTPTRVLRGQKRGLDKFITRSPPAVTDGHLDNIEPASTSNIESCNCKPVFKKTKRKSPFDTIRPRTSSASIGSKSKPESTVSSPNEDTETETDVTKPNLTEPSIQGKSSVVNHEITEASITKPEVTKPSIEKSDVVDDNREGNNVRNPDNVLVEAEKSRITFVSSHLVHSKFEPKPSVKKSGLAFSKEVKIKVSETKNSVHSFVDKTMLSCVVAVSDCVQPSTSKQNLDAERAASTDSISQELVHFQPIQACPRTPPKRLPGGRFIHAPVIKCKPLNLSSPEPSHLSNELTSTSQHHSPVIRRQVALLEAERLVKVGKHSKAVETDTDILRNITSSSPFKTISIGQKRRQGIERSPATKKLRFDLAGDGSDGSDAFNMGVCSKAAVSCLRPKVEKPVEVIIIDSESTRTSSLSSCIIIEEKSTVRPQHNGMHPLKMGADWLDSMGDENHSDNSDGMIQITNYKPVGKKEAPLTQAPVYVLANRLKFVPPPPRESPTVNQNIDDWLRRSQENLECANDPLHVNPSETARRCFSNPGRKIIPEVSNEYYLRRATDNDDSRSASVCPVLQEQQENQQEIRARKLTQMTLLKKVPNKDIRKRRGEKLKNTKTKPPRTRAKRSRNTNNKLKKVNNVVDPSSGEEGGAESYDDPDVELARKLQKQFDMEARFGMIIHKVRGGADEYSFRKRTGSN